MGDPLVVATAKVLLEKILSLATDRIGLVFGFKNDVERLRRSIATIQSVLADAEKKQVQNEAVKFWLKRIEEVSYEADDVFDELNYELLRCRVKTSKNPVKDKVCFFFSSSRTLNFRWRMACKVRDINMKLKLINEDAIGFGLHSHVAIGSNKIFHSPNRETDSFLDQNVVGRENDASQIVQRLRNPSAETVSFIPITGMGGIGKTTLTQLVYNDAQIDQIFDKKIWICVCNNFQATGVLRLILASLKRKSVDIPRDAMVQEIKNELEGKRYLLVLDDVWEDSSTYREWHDFLRSLLGISTVKGNWGLVTTRQLDLASVVTNKELTIALKGLPGDDCWQILNRKAFPRGEVPEELNEMKEEIIKACQGVPLVASVIGGLLSINTKEVWLSIIKDEIRNVSGSVMEILRLSFDHLPSASIKKCFAYCSLFRKSSDMKKDMLIQLWMAEGFLQPNYGNEMEMEAIGLRYFDILVKSSLFQEVIDKLGSKYGRMHDLVHDLARIVSESETVNLGQGLRHDIPGTRYLVLDSLQESTKKMLKERSCSLRTIFVECDIRNDFLLNFKGVRVLNSATGLECIHFRNSISKLIHLRYLHLSVPFDVEALPESLCKLYNLQTLRIYGHVITKLPEGMSNLISLRHLHCDFSTEELQMPLRMGDLKCLRTLEFFNIGREKGRQIEEIGFLMNIRDGLQIRNLELVNSKEEAQRANLFAKSKLINLSLNWEEHREGDNIDENVLEGLKPHPNLQKLVVKNFMGTHFPSWIMKMGHNNLESLELNNCKRCEEIPKLGQLPLLKFLKLYELDNIRCIGFSFYGVDACSSTDPPRIVPKKLFPALKMLKLYNLPNLVDWVGAETLLANGDTLLATGDSIEAFPNLEELSISNCPQLITAPNHFQCLKKLEMSKTGGNTGLLVSSMCNKVTTLTELRIEYAQVLTCIPDMIFSNNQNLVNLTLVGCSNLTHVESGSFSACKNLRQLHISRCSNLKSISAPNGQQQQQQLPSTLRSLRIFYCSNLISLPGELIQSCTSLEALEVFSCQKLVSFPIDLQQTLSLLLLDLHDCPQLITMPKGFSNCNKLREIAIGPFSDSVEFNWSALSSLSIRTLKLYGWPHSVGLPDQLQGLVQIKDLLLCKFGSIESLPDWLEKCVSLEQLSLWNCHKLKYLPSKEATRRLTNLHQLLVYRCPILAERCSPSNGPDSEWSKISHVYMIIIDGKPIMGSG